MHAGELMHGRGASEQQHLRHQEVGQEGKAQEHLVRQIGPESVVGRGRM
jgi:hypothetical protein